MQDRWTDGDAYEMYVGRWSRKIGAGFLTWLDAPSNMRWLDLGCGTGALTSQILNRCGPISIVGIEPSEGFLSLAREQIDDKRAEFRQGSGTEIPIPDDSVDVSVSGLVLNFIPDQQQALKELIRCTAPGGTIAAYVWDYSGHVQFMRYFWDAAVALDSSAAEKDEGNRFPICRPEPLENLFKGAGLNNIAIEPIDIATPFKNFNDYWTPFHNGGTGPAPGYCYSLNETDRNRLKERLQKTLPTDPDGMILMAARAWAVRGTR